MFIYILESTLFLGQYRRVILSFPLPVEDVEKMANYDNNYAPEKQWRVTFRH